MKKQLKLASNKATARQANLKAKNQRQELIVNQVFQEAYSELIKDPQYEGKTLDEMKNIMMHDKGGKWAQLVSKRMGGVAPMLFGGIDVFEAPSENSVLIHNTNKVYNNKLKNTKADEIKDSLKRSRVDFFDRITNGVNAVSLPKAQTGQQLMQKVAEFDYQHISSSAKQKVHEMDSAYEFFKQNGNVFAFDTETFGGKNYDGVTELFTIHDISYIHGNVNMPESLQEVSFIRGLTDAEAQKMTEEIERIFRTGDTSSKANVYRKALITYSGDINEMTTTKDGLMRMVNPVDYDPHAVYSLEDFKKGIENLQKINRSYKRQENGLTAYEEKVADMIRMMNGDSHAVLTYNGTYADMPWMNSFINDTYKGLDQKGQQSFLKKAGLSRMQNIEVKNNLDLMNILREASSSKLIQEIYSTPNLSSERMNAGLTALSQEAVVTALLGSAGNAHTSLDDTRNLLSLATREYKLGENQANLLDYAMEIVRQKHDGKVDEVTKIVPGAGDLFYATKALGFDDTKGAMSFTYDPVSKAIRTASGYDIGEANKDGISKVTKQSYNLNPIKRKQFFTIEDVYKITSDDANWNDIAGQFSELNAPELYVAKVMPHYNKGVKGVNIGMEQPSYIVAQTQELLSAAISGRAVHAGTVKNGMYTMSESAADYFRVKTLDTAGNVVEETTDLGLAVAVQTNNLIADNTRRSVAEMKHSRYGKFKEFEKLATQVYGKDYEINQAQKLFNRLALANGQDVAIKVAKGETVTVNGSALTDILSAKNMRTRNEVDNLKHAFGFWKEIQPIADLVHEQVTAAYGDTQARNYAFENVMNNIMATAADELAKDSKGSIDIRRAYLNSLTNTQHLASDLEGMTFELPGLLKSKNTWLDSPLSVTDSTQSMTFNLNGDSYGLRRVINEKLNPNSTAKGYAKAQEELIAMKEFMQAANYSKEYSGMFNELLYDYHALNDVDILANRMLETMKTARLEDPTLGMRNDILMQNIDKGHAGIKYIKDKYAGKLDSFVKNQVDEVPTVKILNKNNKLGNDILDDLIDNYLVDLRIEGEKIHSAQDYITRIGHSGIEAQYFVDNVTQTKQAYRSFINSYIENYSTGGNVDFVYDYDKHRLIAKSAGEESIDITAKLPRIVGRGKSIHAEQGNMKMAFRGILNMEKFVNGDTLDPNAVTIDSNIAYALNHAMEDMKYRIDQTLLDGEQMRGAEYTLSNIGKYMYGGKKNRKSGITHIAPTVGYSNKEALSFLGIDLKDAYSYMKEIAGMDVMKDKDFATKDILKILEESSDFNINTMTNKQARSLTRNFNHMLQILFKDNHSVNSIIEQLNPSAVKHTELNYGYQMIGGTNLDPLFGNNGSRPVPYTALLRRSKRETQTALDALAETNAAGFNYSGRVGDVFSLDVAHKRSKVKVHGVGDVTENVVLSKANLSELGYKTILAQYLEKEESSNLPQAVVDRLRAVNLTEQEKVLDGRVADALFRTQQVQNLAMPSQLPEYAEQMQHFNNASYSIKKGKKGYEFSYNKNGKIFKSGSVVGYKDGYNGVEAMTAKFEGRLKFGIFSENMLVDEKTITSMIQKAGSKKEAVEIIKQNFDDSGRFYLDRVSDVGYIKLLNGGVEKDMASKMLMGVGSIDEDVRTFFKRIHRGKDIGESRIYQIDELYQVVDNNYKKYKKAMGENALSKNVLMEKILTERYAATDALQQMLQGAGAQEGVAIVAAHEMEKHGSRMMAFTEQVATMQHNLVKSGKVSSMEEAAVYMKERLEKSDEKNAYGIFNNGELKVDGSTIVLPQDWNGVNEDGSLKEINLQRFRQMVKDEGYSDKDMFTTGALLKAKTDDNNDAVVGSIVMSSVSEADDYQGISTASQFNLATKELDSEIQKYKNLANAVKETSPEMQKAYQNRVQELKEKKRMINSALAEKQRGRSYGKRDIQMMQMQKFDDAFNSTVKRAFQYDEKSYTKLMKELSVSGSRKNGEFVLKEEIKSQAVLSEWVDQIKKNMVLGKPGEEVLDSADGAAFTARLNSLYLDQNAKATIEKLIRNDGAMSKEYAEAIYTFMKGQEASRFNTGLIRRENKRTGVKEIVPIRERSIQTVEEMEARGFRKLALADALEAGELDAGKIVDNPGSIFRKNILLDLGEEAGEETRYIAMPFVGNKTTVGDELTDSHIIQRNFQTQMRTLQNRRNDILELKRSADGTPKHKEALEKAVARYQDAAEEMRRAIHVDVMGKNGVLGQLANYRAEFSLNAKTSSYVYMDDNMFNHIAYSDTKEQVQNLVQSYLHSYDNANYAPLYRAKVNGMTLAQHYAEGRYFNARFANVNSLSAMGLFDKNFIKQQMVDYDATRFFEETGMDQADIEKFNKLSETARTRQMYEHRLKTEGIMVDTTRYPTIKQGSTAPSMMYLDETLPDMVTKVGIEAQLGYTGDNDGDHVVSNLIFRRVKDADGKDFIETSMNAKDDRMFVNALGYMHYQAAGANTYWRREAEEIIYKSMKTGKTNGDIDSMLSENRILNTYVGVASLDHVNEYRKDMEEFLAMYSNYKGQEEVFSIADVHNGGKEFANDLDVFLKTIENPEERSRYLKAYGFEMQHGKMFTDMHAKDNLHYTGHVNVPLYRQREIMDLRMVADASATTEEQHLLNRAFGTIEQKIISSKKMEYSDAESESFSAIEEKIEKFTSSLNKIFYNRKEGTEDMRKWLTDNQDVQEGLLSNAIELMSEGHFDKNMTEKFFSLEAKLGKEIYDDSVRAAAEKEMSLLKTSIQEKMTESVVDSLAALNSDQLKEMKSRYALGVLTSYNDNINMQQITHYLGDKGLLGTVLEKAQAAGADINVATDYAFKSGKSSAFTAEAEEVAAYAFDADADEAGQAGRKVVQSLQKAASHMKPINGLGIGAMAVAASVLAVGAVGGNPSQATGMEAAEAAQVDMSYLDMMGPITPQTTQTNTGYVINVKGRGNRASLNRASQQIARSVGGSFSNDVNINMNISEDSTIINDRFLEQMISDAIR